MTAAVTKEVGKSFTDDSESGWLDWPPGPPMRSPATVGAVVGAKRKVNKQHSKYSSRHQASQACRAAPRNRGRRARPSICTISAAPSAAKSATARCALLGQDTACATAACQ